MRRDGPLWLRFRAGEGVEPPRVAYAIGRKVGNAPARNRLRRRLRAAVAELAEELPRGSSCLFGADAAAVKLSPAELRSTVRRLASGAVR